MTAKECAEYWKQIVGIYKETRDLTPEDTAARIVEKISRPKAMMVFSTIAHIKEHDGRIYGKNREVMNRTPYVKEATVYEGYNPMKYAGVDDIHTTHINQIITELIREGNHG